MLRIRPTIVTRSTTSSSGQCHYSIMSRAKQRAGLSTKGDRSSDQTGIPRNLIKPKANAQLPPSRRRQVIHPETPLNESSSGRGSSTNKEWTTRGLAKKSALGEAMAMASSKKSIPLGAPKVTTATTRSPPFPINPRQPAGMLTIVVHDEKIGC